MSKVIDRRSFLEALAASVATEYKSAIGKFNVLYTGPMRSIAEAG